MTPLLSQIQQSLGGAYVVERELGGGGMSRVFVARDEVLGRRVVVKILLPELAEGLSVERFRREIQLAVALQHPNIIPVLSAGEGDGLPYFIMPFVEGESLRMRIAKGPMLVPEVVRILRDIARALAYAHSQGVVHRDIKPENVLLTSGAAVVADFGVAKAFSSALKTRGSAAGASHTLTVAGTSLGTPRYMAPEQAVADPNVDHRADIYAFGVMAYEMLAGTPPFDAATHQELLTAHLTTPPPPLASRRVSVPEALERLIIHCLEKSPDKRPQNAQEIIEALDDPSVVSGAFSPSAEVRLAADAAASTRRRLWRVVAALVGAGVLFGVWRVAARPAAPVASVPTPAPAVAALPSLAVLPFVNIGRDSSDAYLADGLTEEVTTALGTVRGIRVVPRSLASNARQAEVALDSIGQRLGVSSLLEGTVQRDGKRLRVTARLVNSGDGTMVWSDVFDGNLTDVFAVQQKISRSIADALGRELVRADDSTATLAAAPSKKEPSPDAYAAYLRGRFYFQRRGGEALRQSITNFQTAIAHDSSFAASYAGLAQALSQLPHYHAGIADSAWRAAIGQADKALKLDSSLGVAWAARGAARAGRWQWADAERDLRKASALSATDASPHQWLGELLLVQGRAADALGELKKARDADPTSAVIAGSLAYATAIAGSASTAISDAKAAVAREPDLWLTHFMLGACYVSAGQFADAVQELERTQRLPGGNAPMVLGMLGYAYARAGDPLRARALLSALEQNTAKGQNAMPVARVALGLGDTAKALDWLERAVAQRETAFSEEPLASSVFDPLRGSGRFVEIVRRLGLDERLAHKASR